jgi:peptide/nickel transport system substrate-binding protein
MNRTDTLEGLTKRFQKGDYSRREFIQRAAALGLGAPLAAAIAGPARNAVAGPSSRNEASLIHAQDGGVELTVGVVEEPDTLEPHNLTAAAAGLISYVVMPGLVWWDYDLGVSPMIAESWETSEDGLTWTFTLRPNLTFHNGKACTAQEVVRNFEHIIDPEGGSFLAPDYESVASVEAPDDTTVVFTLSEPFAPFLAVLTNRCAITDMDAYDNTKPIGTGPFKIVDWTRGTGVKLEAHDGYWEEGLPKAARVNWNFYPETDSRVLALQGGEIDIGSRSNRSRARERSPSSLFRAWSMTTSPSIARKAPSRMSGCARPLPMPSTRRSSLKARSGGMVRSPTSPSRLPRPGT